MPNIQQQPAPGPAPIPSGGAPTGGIAKVKEEKKVRGRRHAETQLSDLHGKRDKQCQQAFASIQRVEDFIKERVPLSDARFAGYHTTAVSLTGKGAKMTLREADACYAMANELGLSRALDESLPELDIDGLHKQASTPAPLDPKTTVDAFKATVRPKFGPGEVQDVLHDTADIARRDATAPGARIVPDANGRVADPDDECSDRLGRNLAAGEDLSKSLLGEITDFPKFQKDAAAFVRQRPHYASLLPAADVPHAADLVLRWMEGKPIETVAKALDSLSSAMVSGNGSISEEAKQLRDLMRGQLDQLSFAAQLLGDEGFLALVPDASRQKMRDLGRRFEKVARDVMNPQGAFMATYRLAQAAATSPGAVQAEWMQTLEIPPAPTVQPPPLPVTQQTPQVQPGLISPAPTEQPPPLPVIQQAPQVQPSLIPPAPTDLPPPLPDAVSAVPPVVATPVVNQPLLAPGGNQGQSSPPVLPVGKKPVLQRQKEVKSGLYVSKPPAHKPPPVPIQSSSLPPNRPPPDVPVPTGNPPPLPEAAANTPPSAAVAHFDVPPPNDMPPPVPVPSASLSATGTEALVQQTVPVPPDDPPPLPPREGPPPPKDIPLTPAAATAASAKFSAAVHPRQVNGEWSHVFHDLAASFKARQSRPEARPEDKLLNDLLSLASATASFRTTDAAQSNLGARLANQSDKLQKDLVEELPKIVDELAGLFSRHGAALPEDKKKELRVRMTDLLEDAISLSIQPGELGKHFMRVSDDLNDPQGPFMAAYLLVGGAADAPEQIGAQPVSATPLATDNAVRSTLASCGVLLDQVKKAGGAAPAKGKAPHRFRPFANVFGKPKPKAVPAAEQPRLVSHLVEGKSHAERLREATKAGGYAAWGRSVTAPLEAIEKALTEELPGMLADLRKAIEQNDLVLQKTAAKAMRASMSKLWSKTGTAASALLGNREGADNWPAGLSQQAASLRRKFIDIETALLDPDGAFMATYLLVDDIAERPAPAGAQTASVIPPPPDDAPPPLPVDVPPPTDIPPPPPKTQPAPLTT